MIRKVENFVLLVFWRYRASRISSVFFKCSISSIDEVLRRAVTIVDDAGLLLYGSFADIESPRLVAGLWHALLAFVTPLSRRPVME